MKRAALACALLAGWVAPARADEQLFGFVAGSETLPGGRREAYFEATDRRGKPGGYNAQDYRFGVEYGLNAYLQAALYLGLRSHDVAAAGFTPVERDFGFQGVHAALKQVILSPYKDGIGLAVAVEPAYSRIARVSGQRHEQYELELRVILQKTFIDDQLVWGTNLGFDQQWERRRGGDEWTDQLRLDAATGLSYRVAPNWFVGVEGRYAATYRDLLDDRSGDAIFLGPVVHYATQRWWVTLSLQPQIDGGPNAPGGSRHLVEYEKRELRLKIGYNF